MPLTAPTPIEINWYPTTRHWSLNSPNQVECADVGHYELTAFDLQCPELIGWEIHTGGIAVTKGTAPSFAAAKTAAGVALLVIQDIPPETLRKPVIAHRSAP